MLRWRVQRPCAGWRGPYHRLEPDDCALSRTPHDLKQDTVEPQPVGGDCQRIVDVVQAQDKGGSVSAGPCGCAPNFTLVFMEASHNVCK